MGDLEDSFLKQNVPGRYSSWTEEVDDRRRAGNDDGDGDVGGGGSDSEDDEYYLEGIPDGWKPPQGQMLRPSGNTGVKGVLADYEEAQRAERLEREEERSERAHALLRATCPAVSHRSSEDNGEENGVDNDGDGSCSENSDDDEFLNQFRNQRLAELKREQLDRSATQRSFGSLTQCSPGEYASLVDSIDSDVFLVVHLHEDRILECRALHPALEGAAQSMEHVKFVEVNALEANPGLDTICLPTLLIYRGGELAYNLVRFVDGLPRGFAMQDVTDALEGLLGPGPSNRHH